MKFCKCGCRYLLAIDPGLMTGVCLIDISNYENPTKIWSVEVTVPQFYEKIEELVSNPEHHILIENFIITEETAKKTQAPWSLQLKGAVEFLCFKYGRPMDVQTPLEKDFATNDKLRSVDFWHVGEAGHANDSLRHAIVWIVNRNRRWTKKLLV